MDLPLNKPIGATQENPAVIRLRHELRQSQKELSLLVLELERHRKHIQYLKPLLDGLCEAQLAGDTGTVTDIVQGLAETYRSNMELLNARRSTH